MSNLDERELSSGSFSPETRALLGAATADEQLSGDTRARLKAKTFSSLGLGVASGAGSALIAERAAAAGVKAANATAVATKALGAKSGVASVLGTKWLLGAVTSLSVVAGAVGVGRHLTTDATPSPVAAGQHPQEGMPSPSSVAPIEVAVTAARPPELTGSGAESGLPAIERAEPTTGRSASANAPATQGGSLEDETRLLARAQSLFGQGAYEATLDVCATHQAQFPKGALVPERRTLMTMALCKMGRRSEGRSLAGKLLTANTPAGDRVRAVCGE